MGGGSTGAGHADQYVRGGYLTSIPYGWLLADAIASPAVNAADKVVFMPRPGALASSCTTVTQTAYPDVPTDQICASGSTHVPERGADVLFRAAHHRDRHLRARVPVVGTYNKVDSYALTQQFDTGTGESSAVMALTAHHQDDRTRPVPPR